MTDYSTGWSKDSTARQLYNASVVNENTVGRTEIERRTYANGKALAEKKLPIFFTFRGEESCDDQEYAGDEQRNFKVDQIEQSSVY